jgi:hypothetical protein
MSGEDQIYEYLLASKEAIRDNIGNPVESKRFLIRFKAWFSKQKFNILSFIESTSMGQRVLNMKDLRLVVINELDTVFNAMRTMSINRLDDDTLEDMMDDLADLFDCINLDSFKPENYEFDTNLSSNLMELIGKTQLVSKDTSAITWSAPSAPGLQNSERIIPIKDSSTTKPVQQIEESPSPRSQQKVVQSQPQPQIINNTQSKLQPQPPQNSKNTQSKLQPQPPQNSKNTQLKSQPQNSASQISADRSKPVEGRPEPLQRANSDDDVSLRSSDEDSLYSYGGSEFDEEKFSSLAMSASLRSALGFDATPVETDWKPPVASGVQNSKPIFVGKKPLR